MQQPTPPAPVYLRVAEVAQRLDRSREGVYRLIRDGRLPAQRIGQGHYRIREEDVVLLLERERAVAAEKNEVHGPSVIARTAATPRRSRRPDHFGERRRSREALPIPSELDPDLAQPSVVSAPPSDQFTIEYLIHEWLDDARGRVRPKKYLSYEQMTLLHILPVLGPWKVERLDIRTVERFLQWKYQSGLSARTVQYLRALLRQAYNEAIRWGWLSRNVPALARGPRAERPAVTVPPLEEAKRLLASFSESRYGPVYITTLGLGLRLGEALGLRWSDVHLPEPRCGEENGGGHGQVTVRVQLQKIGGEWTLVPPKSRTSVRALVLPGFVADALRDRREEQ